MDDFIRAKANDERKRDWCELNNITLVVIDGRKKFDEKSVTEEILEALSGPKE